MIDGQKPFVTKGPNTTESAGATGDHLFSFKKLQKLLLNFSPSALHFLVSGTHSTNGTVECIRRIRRLI